MQLSVGKKVMKREGGVLPDYPATWKGLYLLLEDVEYTEVAVKLKEIITAS